jgi:hypothetical protein
MHTPPLSFLQCLIATLIKPLVDLLLTVYPERSSHFKEFFFMIAFLFYEVRVAICCPAGRGSWMFKDFCNPIKTTTSSCLCN